MCRRYCSTYQALTAVLYTHKPCRSDHTMPQAMSHEPRGTGHMSPVTSHTSHITRRRVNGSSSPSEEVKDVLVSFGHLQELQQSEPPLVAVVELGEHLLELGRHEPEQYSCQWHTGITGYRSNVWTVVSVRGGAVHRPCGLPALSVLECSVLYCTVMCCAVS